MRFSLRSSGLIFSLHLLAFLTVNRWSAEARSIFQNIPGVQLLSDLTETTLNTFNGFLDETMDFVSNEIRKECSDCKKDPDTNRNVSEIIRSRDYIAEEYDVVTKDGYILTIQRIVNPLVKEDYKAKMKPVILQHGLMSSSVDWVINSLNVRPAEFPIKSDRDDEEEESINSLADTQEHPNALGFYLANRGYDVFLANSRGNIYGQRHVNMSNWMPKFWSFTFDEQIAYDLPAVIEFVQRLTKHQKIGYVGHSQGTLMMFGLLSDRPEYADIIEPFVALAPVAYVNHCVTPAKYFAVYTPFFQHINMWFATSNAAVKYLSPIVCGPQVVRRELCGNLIFLSTGFDEEELDYDRADAYLTHMPSGTSVKNIAHYGQSIISGRFAKFDHGILTNLIRYNSTKTPDYDLTKIRSKSIALFFAENDWLASPKDVARLRATLRVEPHTLVNMTEIKPKWNHIDFVYGKDTGKYVNTRIEKVFSAFN